MNPNRKGQAGNSVSTGMRSATYTPFVNTHFNLPYGLQLQQKVGQAIITNVEDLGATVRYTANNDYSAGNIVSIYGVNPVAYNLHSATILSATSTTFTITTAAGGVYVSGGIAQRTGIIPVTIPAGINFVYAIAVGGGSIGYFPAGSWGGGASGGVSWGWTIATSSCVVGNGGNSAINNNGTFTRYGNIIAGGGNVSFNGVLGAGGAGGFYAGGTSYWGVPGGAIGVTGGNLNGSNGAGGGGARNAAVNGGIGGKGGDGISGGGGGGSAIAGSENNTAGNGGSGLVGGGGGGAGTTTGIRTGGNGGKGLNILTGEITTGGSGTTGTNTNGGGGGGAGIVGNGSNASGTNGGAGGYGGGGGGSGTQSGTGGAGVLYLFY